MATIYDVAKAAGVSPKTVSRVLNGDAPVGAETRDAVEKAILELGYVPSNAARQLRSSKSGLIGLITGAISIAPNATEPHGLPDLFIVQGIQRVIATSGKVLMIADTGGRLDSVPHLMRTFLEHRVEGLIYVAEYHQEVHLPDHPADTPLVLANCFDANGTPAIVPDDRRTQYDLIRELIRAGHHRIAYITLDQEKVATPLRVAGYRAALAEAGIPHDPALEQTGFFAGPVQDTQLLWDALDRLLNLVEPPTVIACGNDEMAMRLYGILRTRGIKVPEDISVAGFDNYRAISETLFPPLTTVELAYSIIGVRAAERLLSLIRGEKIQQSNPTLVAGPVSWRSSVTTRPNIRYLNPQGRKTL